MKTPKPFFLVTSILVFFSVITLRETEFSDQLNNRRTFQGFTALHYAVLANDFTIVRLLLDAGANPLIENDAGHQPIMFAKAEQIKDLLDRAMSEVKFVFSVSDRSREWSREVTFNEMEWRVRRHTYVQAALRKIFLKNIPTN